MKIINPDKSNVWIDIELVSIYFTIVLYYYYY